MATLTSKIKPFVIQSLIDSVSFSNPISWTSSTHYSLGTQVVSAGNIYICSQAGISSSGSGPQSTGQVADGTCLWVYVKPSKLASSINSNLYVGIGRTEAWPNDSAPPAEDVSNSGLEAVQDDLICLLKVTESNVRVGLARATWATGTVYHAYSGTNGDPLGYVSIGTGDIYKCLDNNSGAPSTIQPSGQSTAPLNTSDGYVWKYMGSANALDIVDFGTTSYIPVSVSTATGSAQWDVQVAAKAGQISSFVNPYTLLGSGSVTTVSSKLVSYNASGVVVTPASASTISTTITSNQVSHIFTTVPGQGYGDNTWVVVYDSTAADGGCSATVNITTGAVTGITINTAGTAYTNGAIAVIVGDGTGATAAPVLDGTSHVINSFTVSGGSGYTWAQVVIIPGSVGWVSKAIIGPPAGHGANIITELGASGLLMSFDVTSTLSPYVQSSFTYRQISLISSIQPVQGYASNSFAYIGPEHASWNSGVYSASDPLKYNTTSGEVLYVNNYTPVNHTITNEEIIKISISF